jgi:hypothetical protein
MKETLLHILVLVTLQFFKQSLKEFSLFSQLLQKWWLYLEQ